MLDRTVADILVGAGTGGRGGLEERSAVQRFLVAGIESVHDGMDRRDPGKDQEQPGQVLRRKVSTGIHGGYDSNRQSGKPAIHPDGSDLAQKTGRVLRSTQ